MRQISSKLILKWIRNQFN